MSAKANRPAEAPAIATPQTDGEADQLLAEYGRLCVTVVDAEARMTEELATVKLRHEAAAKPSQERLDAIFDTLNQYAANHRDRLTQDGRTKTVQLPAGQIGWRNNPPKVTWAKGFNADKIVDAIYNAAGQLRGKKREVVEQQTKLYALVRVKKEPNKEAMLADPETAKGVRGIKIGSKGEDFFVDPFGAALAEPKP